MFVISWDKKPNLGQIPDQYWEKLINKFVDYTLVGTNDFVHTVTIRVPEDGKTARVLCHLNEREGYTTLTFKFDMYSCTECFIRNNKRKVNLKTDAISEIWQTFLIDFLNDAYQTNLINYYKLHDKDLTHITKVMRRVNAKRRKENGKNPRL